jgi:hypothetical protein
MQFCVQLSSNNSIQLLSTLEHYSQYINIYNTRFNTNMTSFCIKVISEYANIMNIIKSYDLSFSDYEILCNNNNNNINYHKKENPWFVTSIIMICVSLIFLIILIFMWSLLNGIRIR